MCDLLSERWRCDASWDAEAEAEAERGDRVGTQKQTKLYRKATWVNMSMNVQFGSIMVHFRSILASYIGVYMFIRVKKLTSRGS